MQNNNIAGLFAVLAVFCALPTWAQESSALEEFYLGAPGKGAYFEHKVRRGETLFDLADRYLGNPYLAAQLAEQNGIKHPLRLAPDSLVKIPQGKMGLLFSIHKADGAKNIIEVTDRYRFSKDDKFQLRLSANSNGYLYVYNLSGGKEARRLVPEQKGVAEKIEQFREYLVPQEGWFRFDRRDGDEQLLIIVSAEPLAELDTALLADGALRSKIESWADDKAPALAIEGNNERGSAVVMRSPLGGARLLAYRVVLRRKS